MINDFDEALVAAMKMLSQLSDEAKSSGDLPTMYAMNRAWHELNRAREARDQRRATLSN